MMLPITTVYDVYTIALLFVVHKPSLPITTCNGTQGNTRIFDGGELQAFDLAECSMRYADAAVPRQHLHKVKSERPALRHHPVLRQWDWTEHWHCFSDRTSLLNPIC
ncbi:hypothetical protein ACJJTC_003606 [Scirpophaga incertulas]